MNLHLHSRFYHLLWRLMPKQTTEIAGHTIAYCILPWWLLIGDSEAKGLFQNAYCLVHKSSESPMIYISSRLSGEEVLRYTLYHEFLEGSCLLRGVGTTESQAQVRQALKHSIAWIREDAPEITEQFRKSLISGQDKCHIFALIGELALAKQEMSPETFSAYLAHTYQNRL